MAPSLFALLLLHLDLLVQSRQAVLQLLLLDALHLDVEEVVLLLLRQVP